MSAGRPGRSEVPHSYITLLLRLKWTVRFWSHDGFLSDQSSPVSPCDESIYAVGEVKNLRSGPSAARQAQVGEKVARPGHTAPALPARGDGHLKSFQLESLHTSVTTKGSK